LLCERTRNEFLRGPWFADGCGSDVHADAMCALRLPWARMQWHKEGTPETNFCQYDMNDYYHNMLMDAQKKVGDTPKIIIGKYHI